MVLSVFRRFSFLRGYQWNSKNTEVHVQQQQQQQQKPPTHIDIYYLKHLNLH